MEPVKTRTRRSMEDREKDLLAKLAAHRAKAASKTVLEAVKAGHVTDIKRAKELSRDYAALNRCRETIVGLKWATDQSVSEQITKILAALTALVKAPPAAAPAKG